MKISTLIKRLEQIQGKIQNEFEIQDPKVVVDCDGIGYYDLETVKICHVDGAVVVNIQSSNES